MAISSVGIGGISNPELGASSVIGGISSPQNEFRLFTLYHVLRLEIPMAEGGS